MTEKKRILLIMSDTGGGHRAAAEAIREALVTRYAGKIDATLVDAFRASGFPFKYMPEVYPIVIQYSRTGWAATYNFLDTPKRVKLATRGIYIAAEVGLKKMLREHPADVIVCVHSVLTQPTLQAAMRLKQRPPFMVVVTDLLTTHNFWYDPRTDRTLVPTQEAYDIAIDAGLKPETVRVTGLPVHPRFSQPLGERDELRRQLGWRVDLPALLLIGGGEGMGPLYKTARAINALNLPCQLVIVAGRNKTLKEKLESASWNQPVIVYGYVTEMPMLMKASSVLITKAGPATISEACIAHLPMILYDAIPGQETGNVELVVKNDAGVYAPGPELVAQTLAEWFREGTDGLQRRAQNAARLAKPNAVWDIADEIWDYAQRAPVQRRRRLPTLLKQIAPSVKIPKIKLLD
jgi:1,2-diacylglycerol 3-beta-galactosyltransferase